MLRAALLIALTAVVACGRDTPAPCGVTWDGAEPALGTMVLSDGTVLSEGSWAATRINAGTLTIDLRAMDSEPSLGDALDGTMPVCRTLDDQNDQVIYHDNGPWITDSSHTGTVAITEFTTVMPTCVDAVCTQAPVSAPARSCVNDDDCTTYGLVKGQFSVTLKSTTGDMRELSGAFFVAPWR